MERIFGSEPGKVHIEFNEKYGGATRYHGLLGVSSERLADVELKKGRLES